MKKMLFIQILSCMTLLFYAFPLNAQTSNGTSGIAIPSNLHHITSSTHNDLNCFSIFGRTQLNMDKPEKVYLKKQHIKKITRGTYSLSLSME